VGLDQSAALKAPCRDLSTPLVNDDLNQRKPLAALLTYARKFYEMITPKHQPFRA
jgi:hypothetical protein